jgi:hypothetical protein
LYPNAAAAYSLRKLRTAYSGPAIEARKTVGGETFVQDIGFVDNELDTASLLTFANGGDVFVAKWYDQSGNGNNDAFQVSQSSQASIVLSGVLNTTNGNVAALGTSNTVYVTGYSIFNGADGTYSGFVVSKLISAFDGVMQLNNLSSGGGGEIFRYFNTSSTTFRVQSWDSGGGAPVLVTEPINANSNAISSFIRGLDSLTTSSNSLTNSLLGLGEPRKNIEDRLTIMGSNVAGFGLESYFSEAILYPSDQSANRAGIESNINKNYNIYWDGSQTGLLDDYPSAVAAYSLRALNSAYTGPAIEARRSSDDAVQDIGFLYDGSLDTESLLTFADGGDVFVAKWYDQSGGGYDSLQPFAAQQPQIVDLGSVVTLNGKPTILSSVGKAMYTASNSVPVVGDLGERSSFSVLNSSSSGLQVAISYVDGGTNLFFPIAFNTGIAFSRNNDPASNATAPYTANSDVVFTSLLNSTNSEVFLNGVSGGGVTGFIPQTGTSRINVFARYANVWTLVGQVSEIILYPSDQSTNREAIETNINNYYTIYP